jgi:hypothetical protein
MSANVFQGPTSNLTLIRQIAHALSRITGKTSRNRTVLVRQEDFSHDPRGTPVSAPLGESVTNSGQCDVFALPSEDQINEMLRDYFSTTNLFVPCLNEEVFLETYKQGRRHGPHKFRKTWLATLNLIFAITTTASSHGTSPSEDQANIAETYYQRALALCTPSVIKGTSHEIGRTLKTSISSRSTNCAVQFLVLMETYLQGSQRSVQTWTFHGITVEAAFQAGLHSTQTLAGLPMSEQEMRKRTWYCCVMNDR